MSEKLPRVEGEKKKKKSFPTHSRERLEIDAAQIRLSFHLTQDLEEIQSTNS